MTTIHNDQEWIAFCQTRYPNYTPDKFPPAYPCQAKIGSESAGIMGYWATFNVRYETGLPHAPYTAWQTIIQA